MFPGEGLEQAGLSWRMDGQTDRAGKRFLWLLLKVGRGFFMPDVFGKS